MNKSFSVAPSQRSSSGRTDIKMNRKRFRDGERSWDSSCLALSTFARPTR